MLMQLFNTKLWRWRRTSLFSARTDLESSKDIKARRSSRLSVIDMKYFSCFEIHNPITCPSHKQCFSVIDSYSFDVTASGHG